MLNEGGKFFGQRRPGVQIFILFHWKPQRKGAEPERFQMRETCSVHWETCHRLEVYGPIFKYDMSNGSI